MVIGVFYRDSRDLVMDLAAQARFFIEDQYRYNSVIEIIATYGETNLDIVRPVINYTVSLYTGNVYVLFMIYGLLFGIVFFK